MKIRIAAIAVLVALAAIPVALGAHTDPDDPQAPGACDTDPGNSGSTRWFYDATGVGVVCVDILGIEPFSPAVLRIDAETTVVWENEDDFTHTVTLFAGTGQPTFDHTLPPGTHAWETFDSPGTYYYQCQFSPFHTAGMHGKIVVT